MRLAAMWIALMLTYLLGDVLRIFAGDFKPGEIDGVTATPTIWLAAAAIMLVPIVMVVLTVSFGGQPIRWANIVAAIGLFVFNLVGLPGYPGLYDRFLILVGLGFNAITVWQAWNWEPG
jgi:ABC-type transport system involved in cytochrome c biogenesis permease component